jgi:hypothetical protein
MLAGLDTSVLTDVRLLGIEMVLGRTLTGRGCTTGFVDRGFHDPTRGERRGIAAAFPFVDLDAVNPPKKVLRASIRVT